MSVENFNELVRLKIPIAFHMNFDVADDEEWVGVRDDAVQNI